MGRARRSVMASLLVATSVSAAATAHAIKPPTVYDNVRSFPVGSRAAGMAGAYTALGCDEGALLYNPAALACAEHSHLELAANSYIIHSLSIPDAFGRGEDISATTFQAIPSVVGGVYLLAPGDEQTGAGRIGAGLSVSVPRSVLLKADPADPKRVNFVSFSTFDSITALDVGLGVQVLPTLALGLSIGGALRTLESRQSSLVASETFFCTADGGAICNDFAFNQIEQEVVAVGLLAKVGARFTPTPELSFGLFVAAPSIDVFGESDLTTTSAYSLTGDPSTFEVQSAGLPTRYEGRSNLSFPLRLVVGGAYSSPGFSLSADLALELPRDVKQAYEMEAVEVAGVDEPPIDDDVLVRGIRPNFAIGSEIGLVEAVALNLGAFTDFSAVDDEAELGADRVHMFGGTVALGFLGRQSRTRVGLSFEYGEHATKVALGDLSIQNALDAGGLEFTEDGSVARWTLAGFLGANYSFLDEAELAQK